MEEAVRSLVGGRPQSVPAVYEQAPDQIESGSKLTYGRGRRGVIHPYCMGVGYEELSLPVFPGRKAVVGSVKAVGAHQGEAVLAHPVDPVCGKCQQEATASDNGEYVGFAGHPPDVLVFRCVKPPRSGYQYAGGINVHFAVRRHFVKQRRLQDGIQAVGQYAAERAVLFLAVFKQQIAGTEVGGVEIVYQPALGSCLRHFQALSVNSPLPYEAHGVHLSGSLPEQDDVLPAAAEESGKRCAVVAYEAGKGAYVDVAPGILPNRFRLHLRQAVEGGEPPVADLALNGLTCARTHAEGHGAQQKQDKTSYAFLFHQLQIYEFSCLHS